MSAASFYQGSPIGTKLALPVTEQLVEKTAEIARLHETITSLNAAVTSLTLENGEYQTQVHQQCTEKMKLREGLNQANARLAQENGTLKGQVSALQSENQQLATQNGELRSVNQNLEDVHTDLNAENDSLRHQLERSLQLNGTQAAEIQRLKNLLMTQGAQMLQMQNLLAQNQNPRGFPPGTAVIHVPSRNGVAPHGGPYRMHSV